MTARPSRAQAACLALMRSALIAESRCRHEGTEIHQWNRKRWEWTHKQRVWITKKHAYARFSLLKSLRYWDTTSNQCSLRVVDHLLTPCTDLLPAPFTLLLSELQTINTLYSTCYWHSCISLILIWCAYDRNRPPHPASMRIFGCAPIATGCVLRHQSIQGQKYYFSSECFSDVC